MSHAHDTGSSENRGRLAKGVRTTRWVDGEHRTIQATPARSAQLPQGATSKLYLGDARHERYASALIYVKRCRQAALSPAPCKSWPEPLIDHLALTMQDTWYVTFELHKRGILPKPRCARRTVTFATEFEARQFARAKVEEGLTVFAGTINPHLPRQLIPAERIMFWIALEQTDSDPSQSDNET